MAQEIKSDLGEPTLSIAPLLKSRFDIDVDIGTGNGTRDDPIIVLPTSASEAARTELLVLRGIGKLRGMMWRTISVSNAMLDDQSSVRRKIETISIEDDQFITQTESFYFLRKAAVDNEVLQSTEVIAHQDKDSGLLFPYEIGWLHFDEIVNYPSESLGYSLSYNAPGIKATIYVYPRDPDTPKPTAVVDELNRFRDEILEVHGPDKIKSIGEIGYSDNVANYLFADEGDSQSYFALMVCATPSHFIKLRVTFRTYSFTSDAFIDFRQRIYAMTVLDIDGR